MCYSGVPIFRFYIEEDLIEEVCCSYPEVRADHAHYDTCIVTIAFCDDGHAATHYGLMEYLAEMLFIQLHIMHTCSMIHGMDLVYLAYEVRQVKSICWSDHLLTTLEDDLV